MSLFVKKFNSCCCGFSLKTGTQIILWLDVISSIYSFACLIILLLVLNSANDEIQSSSYEKKTNNFNAIWAIYFIQNLFLCGLGIIAVVGLYGIHKKKPWLLKPILLFHSINVVILFIAFISSLIGSVISLIEHGKNFPVKAVIFIMMILNIEIFIFFLAWYFTMIIYSYYIQLKEEFDLSQVGSEV